MTSQRRGRVRPSCLLLLLPLAFASCGGGKKGGPDTQDLERHVRETSGFTVSRNLDLEWLLLLSHSESQAWDVRVGRAGRLVFTFSTQGRTPCRLRVPVWEDDTVHATWSLGIGDAGWEAFGGPDSIPEDARRASLEDLTGGQPVLTAGSPALPPGAPLTTWPRHHTKLLGDGRHWAFVLGVVYPRSGDPTLATDPEVFRCVRNFLSAYPRPLFGGARRAAILEGLPTGPCAVAHDARVVEGGQVILPVEGAWTAGQNAEDPVRLAEIRWGVAGRDPPEVTTTWTLDVALEKP